MVRLGDIRVTASIHAAERALARIPELKGADRRQASYWIENTAAMALRDGRKARRCPRWCATATNEYRARLSQEGVIRFVWNEDETAAMIARHGKDIRDPSQRIWIVLTVIART